MAAIDPLEVPPFQLQSLLKDINPHVGDLLELGQNPPTPTVSSPLDLFARVSNSAIGKSATRPSQLQAQVNVRCAQALGRDVYVGNSDGTLVRYSLRDQGTSKDGDSYHVTGRQTLTSRRPIDQIVLIPCIAKLLVFSANTLHFYTLPGIEPVPQALIQSMTRVQAFAVDEQVMRLPVPDHHGPPTVDPVGLCVFNRGQIRMFTLRERLLHVKDVPIPSGLTVPRRWGPTICCADAENYNILGLDQLSFLPVMPLPGLTSPGALPRIIPSGDGGFVILQASGEGSIAVFLTAGGDPGGALIEMPRFPIDVALDPPHFIALLPNNTIEIHNYTQQPPQLVQIIPRPEGFAPHTLSMSGSSGYLVSAGERDSKLSTVRVPLALNPPEGKKEIKIDVNMLEGQSGSGLTPPSSPIPPPKDNTPTSYARSRIMLTSNNAIQSLVPTTLLSQAESLLGAGREKDVIRLLDVVRKKTSDEDQDVQVRYIYTQLGYAKLRETHFEEAGNYFFRAETDARALIRLFPDLREGLPEYDSLEETMPVFKGLEGAVRAATSVEETVRNYSPHLGEGEEPLVTLRDILMGNSRDMLRAFLHKTRNRRRYGGPQARRVNEDGSVWKAVDIVLARLFAEAGETTELLDLVKDSTVLTIPAIEPALVRYRQFQVLVALCAKLGDEARLVSVLAKLHDGEYVDANGGVKDPFERVIQILNQTQDAALVQQYGIWVLKHDPAAGLKIFTSRAVSKLDDAAVLTDMQSVNALAAGRFLEHVVLNKRSSDPNLHNQLVIRYVDEAIATLEKPGVQPMYSEIVQEYVKLPPNPFLLHLANSEAIPEVLDARIRLALFLQGSSLYYPRAVREKLQAPNVNEIFAYERAIIDGKLGHHRKALTILVHEVKDSVSAEVYCALGGVVIPPKVANSVGDRRGMQPHAWLVNIGGRRIGPVSEEKRRELLKTLMEVYTLGGEATAIQTAQLLNSQARNFDPVEVLEAIPESWSLSVISSFLERSLRRTMHESREGMILKHISAGQNLIVVDNAMHVIKDEGYVVEEADDDDDADSDAVLQQDPLDLEGPSSLVSEGLKRLAEPRAVTTLKSLSSRSETMTSNADRVCAYSLVPFEEHDEAIIRLLALPITDQIIHYIACRLVSAVSTPGHHHLPTPPVTPIRGKFAPNSAPCAPEWEFPPLETFLKDLVSFSRIHTASAVGSMIYLRRITKGLQSGAIRHAPETPYRLAVALFTVASKYSHDVSPSTGHWAAFTAAALGIPSLAESISHQYSSASKGSKEGAKYKLDNPQSAEPASLGYLFGPDATAALERDILFLLDFNMRFDEEDLRGCLNALSSHERAEGPLEQLRLGQGRPELRLEEAHLSSVRTSTAIRSIVPLKSESTEDTRKAPTTPHPVSGSRAIIPLVSPPCTPVHGTLKRDYVMKRSSPVTKDSKLNQRTKPLLEVDINPQRPRINSHFLNAQPHTEYPQLNSVMDVDHFLKLVDVFKPKNTFTPIGVPSAPPSTPTAGITSLSFVYGGNVFSPAFQPPTLENLIVAPDKNSPWAPGQVGEILRKTMVHQARRLAALSEKETRNITVLNTPPPIPVFGCGMLYKENPDRSSVELAQMAKLTVSDLRWYYALKRPVPAEMLDGELSREVKDELARLGIPTPNQDHDGMPIDRTTRRGHPVALSLASSSSTHIHPVIKAALDKRIYRHVRGRHYQAVVDSGPVDFLSTRWDRKLQAELEAKGLGECEEQFKTTAPLRLAKKKEGGAQRIRHLEHSLQESGRIMRSDKESAIGGSAAIPLDSKLNWNSTPHRYHSVDRAPGALGLDAGVRFVPAPEATLSEQPHNVGWFSRLLGGSRGRHGDLMKY